LISAYCSHLMVHIEKRWGESARKARVSPGDQNHRVTDVDTTRRGSLLRGTQKKPPEIAKDRPEVAFRVVSLEGGRGGAFLTREKGDPQAPEGFEPNGWRGKDGQ